MTLLGTLLRKPLVATMLAAAAAAGGVILAIAQTPLPGNLARYLEGRWGLLIAVVALVLIALFGIAALVYGMRHDGGGALYRSFRRLIR